MDPKIPPSPRLQVTLAAAPAVALGTALSREADFFLFWVLLKESWDLVT